MSNSLLDLSKISGHTLTFTQTAASLGFAAAGEIDRFLFRSYGKTIKGIPYANRPKGAIFFLNPPGIANALASVVDLKPVLLRIQSEVAQNVYQVPMDLADRPSIVYQPTSVEKKMMASGAWPMGYAQMASRESGKCVVWGNGVGAMVFLGGDIYLESPDVVEELPTGIPSSYQDLSWADGEIVYEFAENELNDTSPAGIWRLPDKCLLRPKPEKLMSLGLGRFLQYRMAGYLCHFEEAHVANEGRADISLTFYNGFVYIVEVKWIGQSLVATKELESNNDIKNALKNGTKGWLTQYDDATFVAGIKQLAKYFKTGKYQRAYLTVFDCSSAKSRRKHESLAIAVADVTPYNRDSFRAHRACVDPRKASQSSKAKSP